MKAIKRNVALLAAMGLMAGSGAVWAIEASDTFTANATLQAGISVTCSDKSLDFGTILRSGNFTSGTTTVTVAATAEGAVTYGEAGKVITSGAGSASCTIANENSSNAVAVLSGGGTWAAPTLPDVVLTDTVDPKQATLSASVTLGDADGVVGNGTYYIGGTLTVPAYDGTGSPNSTYASGVITLTVTD